MYLKPIFAIALTWTSILIGDNQNPRTLFSLVDTTTEKKINLSSLYMKANYFQFEGNMLQAFKTYHDLFAIDAPCHVYDGYLHLLSQTNQFDAIVNLIDKKQTLIKDLLAENLELKLIYAQSLINTNNEDKTKKVLEKLKTEYPNNDQVVFYTAALHEKSNNYQKAIETIDTFLQKNQETKNHTLFHFLKAKMYLKLGKINEALSATNNSLKLFPEFDKAILFKALLLEKLQKFDDAIESYRQFLKVTGPNPLITKQIVQLLFSQQKFNAAASELETIASNQPEFFFDLGLLAWRGQNYNKAISHLEKSISLKSDFTKAKILLLEILFTQKNFDKLLSNALKWLTQDPNDNQIINGLLTLATKGIPIERISEIFAKIKTNHPDLVNITIAHADTLLLSKQYERAITTYNAALNAIKNETLKSHLCFQIGYTYFKMNNTQKALQVLEGALKEKVVHPSTYNLAAYILAQSDTQLNYALDLANKALNIENNSPYFLDTKGLILYKQRKYDQAIQIFEKALHYKPNDEIIKKHLTDAKTKS